MKLGRTETHYLSLTLLFVAYFGIAWYDWKLAILALIFHWGLILQTRVETSDRVATGMVYLFQLIAGKKPGEPTDEE